MKTIAYFIIYLITNSIVAQVVITSEDITVWNDSIQLPGTLKYNKTLEAQPLIIFVPGSGNPDRNGNQPIFNVNPNYINQLSQAITQNDIAFFSYDKRNATKTNKFSNKYRLNDLAKDVKTIINRFKNDTRFNGITLIGHSQGSLVCMLAIDDTVTKFISLAGLGHTADKSLIEQMANKSDFIGLITKQHVEELKQTATIKEVNPMLATLFDKRYFGFLVDYFKIDPREEIKKLTIPTLILNGTKDFQVTEKDAIALKKAKPDARLVMIKNMNHVLKTINKDEDNFKSYNSPDYPLSEELVTLITDFIKD